MAQVQQAVPVAAVVVGQPVQQGGYGQGFVTADKQEYFNQVAPVQPDPVWASVPDMTSQTIGILASCNQFTVRQHIKFREMLSGGCIEQPNTYTIYAGLTDDSIFELFRVQEVSDNCSRCCCAPCHPLKLEVKAFSGVPRKPGQSAESADLERQMAGCCGNRSARAQVISIAKQEDFHYAQQPTLFTGIRNGYRCHSFRSCQNGCCCKDTSDILDSSAHIPSNDALKGRDQYVGCGACMPCCLDGITTVAGKTEEQSTMLLGEVPDDARSRIIGSADQIKTAFTPTITLADGPEPSRMHMGQPVPTGKITGQTIFGGCSELCCDVKFNATREPGGTLGDIGVIVKRKPKNMVQGMRELLTAADTYTIEFTDPTLTVEKKASVLTSLMLLDYMFFEGEQDMCGTTSEGDPYINLFNCYCYGCVCPCRIVFKNNNGG